MAARIMNSHTKLKQLVYRTHSLKALSSQRLFSSQNRGPSESSEQIPKPAEVSAGSASTWLNVRAGIFGPDDQRLPLPGDIGLSQYLNGRLVTPATKEPLSLPSSGQPVALITNQEKQLEEIRQTQQQMHNTSWETVNEECSEFLECRVQESPEILKKDILTLFHSTSLSKQKITAITLCQKTVHDMCGWSEGMEIERTSLIEMFIEAAENICESLRGEGYWADFIDPTSGRPYLGAFTNATFFETDERYRHFGFVIEDLGCCKVITHKKWGSHVFVGSIFTNAPVGSDIIADSLSVYETRSCS